MFSEVIYDVNTFLHHCRQAHAKENMERDDTKHES